MYNSQVLLIFGRMDVKPQHPEKRITRNLRQMVQSGKEKEVK